ncbi:MAG: EF-Hand, calmodulin [Micavibrio sp.]|nr:EF-Hand, calmodulin [Micavibrio sp.]
MSTTSSVSGSSSQAALLQLIQQMRQAAAQKTSATSTSATDTTNSSAAAQALTDFFKSSDTDGNGELSQSEFASGLQTASSSLLSGSNLLQASTSSGNTAQDAIKALIGSIQSQLSGTASTDPKEKFAAALFKTLDSDGDGNVTQGEVESAVTKAGGSKEAADALYAKLDPDNTGSVSQQQLAENLPPPSPRGGHGGPPPGGGGGDSASSSSSSTTYDAADTNQDGTVSAQERLAALFGTSDESSSSTGTTDTDSDATTTASKATDDKKIQSFFTKLRSETMSFLISLQSQAGGSETNGVPAS